MAFFNRPKIGIKVGDIMTRNFIYVSPETSVIDCSREMIKKHVGSLIIKKGNELLGILTEKDIIAAVVRKHNLEKLKARDIMSRKVRTITPEKDIYDALILMKKTKFRWLPVAIKKNVIGLLTLKDILRLEPTLFETFRETMDIREERDKIARRAAASHGVTWARLGECEECKAYGMLYNVKNSFLCEECK